MVLEVYVPVEKVGKIVKKGDPLFLVDNRQLKAQLKYAQANLESAAAQLAKLETAPPRGGAAQRGSRKAAEANLSVQEDNVKRYTEFAPERGG